MLGFRRVHKHQDIGVVISFLWWASRSSLDGDLIGG